MFVGAVTFEVVILEALHRSFDRETMERIEQAVMRRARRVMPWIVATLYATGIAMFTVRCAGLRCPQTHFGGLLLAKVGPALAVLTVFVRAVRSRGGRSDPCRFRHAHRLVLVLMAGIVFLAKAMFYL